jgi:hypothetical protein
MKNIYVKDFTEFPGPRYKTLGEFSGEEFRDKYLIPEIESNDCVSVNFDGVFGFGSSFLEETFGGLVRKGVSEENLRKLVENLKAEEDPSLILEVKQYIKEAIEVKNK